MPAAHRLALLLVLLPFAQANAHDTLPSQWCADSSAEPKIVANFVFTEPTLLKWRSLFVSDQTGACDPNEGTSCGGVDDWGDADRVAHGYCSLYDTPNGKPMPIIFNDTFNTTDHHKAYKLKQGLKGACVVCTPRSD